MTMQNRSDGWLLDVLRGDDLTDVDAAMRALQARYRNKVRSYLARKLPPQWLDDIEQKIWLDIYRQARIREIRDLAAYLGGMMRNVRAREVSKRRDERACEMDFDAEAPSDNIAHWTSSPSIEEQLAADEAYMVQTHQLDLLQQLPFIDLELSDCQRVYWLLRAIYRYPSKVVGRLLGRSVNNIDVQTKKSRTLLKQYFASDAFQAALAQAQLPQVWTPRPNPQSGVVVERFAEAIVPQLSEDELKPLGLTQAELQQHYVASLILPRWQVDAEMNLGGIAMLLARRGDWADWQELCARLARGEGRVDEYIREECFLNLEIEDGYIHVDIHPLVELIPEINEEQLSTDNTYLAIHGVRRVVPVMLGFFDASLYTPEILSRWPFVTPATGL